MSHQRPRVIFFFMNGCPHCERTWPAWDKVKGDIRKVADVSEKELLHRIQGGTLKMIFGAMLVSVAVLLVWWDWNGLRY